MSSFNHACTVLVIISLVLFAIAGMGSTSTKIGEFTVNTTGAPVASPPHYVGVNIADRTSGAIPIRN